MSPDDEEGKEIIEMLWRCGNCRHLNPGVSGEDEGLTCQECGHKKAPKDPWIMPDDALTRPALTGQKEQWGREGEVWRCGFCGHESRQHDTECEECGAHRERPEEPKRLPRSPQPSTPAATVMSAIDRSHQMDREKETEDRRHLVQGVVGAVVLIAIAALLTWVLWPRHVSTVVTSLTWTHVEVRQERHVIAGEGWRDNAPISTFSFDSCDERQRGTHACNPYVCGSRQVPRECNCSGGTPYRCNCTTSVRSNGNGTATRSRSCDTCRTPRICGTCYTTVSVVCQHQCPTMDQWCRYRWYRWDEMERVERRGQGHERPWTMVAGANQEIVRHEILTAVFRPREGAAITLDLPAQQYDTLEVGRPRRLTRYGPHYTVDP